MTSPFKHRARKTESQKRDRSTGRGEASQFELFDTTSAKAGRGSGRAKKEPDTSELLIEPLVVEPVPKSRMLYIRCAYNGKLNGGRFHQDEVDFLLAKFRGPRDRVEDSEFGDAAEKAVANHYRHLTTVVV